MRDPATISCPHCRAPASGARPKTAPSTDHRGRILGHSWDEETWVCQECGRAYTDAEAKPARAAKGETDA